MANLRYAELNSFSCLETTLGMTVRALAAADAMDSAWDHAAAAVHNVARDATGRALLLDDSLGPLLPVLLQAATRSTVAGRLRRRGIAGAVRNCCLDELVHSQLLAACITASDDPPGALLVDVAKNSMGGGRRDPDDDIRQCWAEAIAGLATTSEGLGALWDRGVPEALRTAYAHEESPQVCEVLEATADMFVVAGFGRSGYC